MGRLPRTGSVEVVTGASPEEVWEVLTDVARAGEWSHETKGGEWLDGASGWAVGARFRGRNQQGRTRWRRVNEVLVADRPRELSWRTLPSRLYPDSTRWTYALDPVEGGGTRITQRFELLHINPLIDRLFYLCIPAHRDRTEALRGDLQRLGEVAAGSPATPSGT